MVRIHGLERLRSRLKKAGPGLLDEIAPALEGEAAALLASANVFAPVDDGELIASAFTDGVERDPKRMSVGASAGYDAEHAPFVHEGFHYGLKVASPPKWLERAADAAKPGFVEDMVAAIERGLERIGR
jgi:hypothetical protein